MKIQFLAALAVSSMFALTACSDDESESLADKCETLSEDCLEGTWTLNHVALKEDPSTPLTNFASAPSVLTFNNDGTFSYQFSTLTSGGCAGMTNSGKWALLNDTQLQMKVTNGDCITNRTLSPTVSVESNDAGDKVILNLQEVYFQQDASNGINAGNDTEIFSRTE